VTNPNESDGTRNRRHAATRLRAKLGTVATVVVLVGLASAVMASAHPGPGPTAEADEIEAKGEARHARHLDKQHDERRDGHDRGTRPSAADIEARMDALAADLAAKVEAGQLTRAEADEIEAKVKARVEARHARHLIRTAGSTPGLAAALALARS